MAKQQFIQGKADAVNGFKPTESKGGRRKRQSRNDNYSKDLLNRMFSCSSAFWLPNGFREILGYNLSERYCLIYAFMTADSPV